MGDWTILEIRGARDLPGYDPAEVGRGMDGQTFRREVLGDWSASAGKLVYPEFGSRHLAAEPLAFNPAAPLVCGWDQGGTSGGGTPAFVPTQLNGFGQWLIYPPIVPADDETVGIYDFAQDVASYLRREFAEPAGLELSELRLVHYGDPAGHYPPPKTLVSNARTETQSCYQIIRCGQDVHLGYDERGQPVRQHRPGFGWSIQPGVVSLAKRMEGVRARLTATVRGGLPALVVDPEATMVIEAFQGGYHFHQRSTGEYELDPQKNRYADVMNALEYAASRLFSVRSQEREDEDAVRMPLPVTVRSAGRRIAS